MLLTQSSHAYSQPHLKTKVLVTLEAGGVGREGILALVVVEAKHGSKDETDRDLN